MPRQSNGTYTLPSGNPVVTGTVIESNWANITMPDIGEALTDSLSRTGNGGMRAPLSLVDGSTAAPAVRFSNDADTGMYLGAAGDLRFAASGVDVFRVLDTGEIQIYNTVDALWYPVVDTNTIGGIVEVQPLAAAQTNVPFTANVAGAAFYVDAVSGDRGRLFDPVDYTYNAIDNEVDLVSAFPAGTNLYAVFNDESLVQQAADAAQINAQLAVASADAAAISEANASSSETNAAASELAAANSESNAASSESNAGISETNAAASAAAALASEGNAATSETNAGVSAGQAATSASNAATSASNAASSESNAATSESNAAASETAAGISETNAANSASAASVSAAEAAASAASIDPATLVRKDSDTGGAEIPAGTTAQQPTPNKGVLRYNTDDGGLEVGNGASFDPIGGGGLIRTNRYTSSAAFTADADATKFIVEIVGGGGGGGDFNQSLSGTTGGGGGAGGGGFVRTYYSAAEMGATASVTIGNGGSHSANGGNTTFNPAGTGATITAGGGKAGGDTGGTGAGGTATGGDLNCIGSDGSSPAAKSNTGGQGGTSHFGGGGSGAQGEANGAAGNSFGGGGGGAGSTSSSSGTSSKDGGAGAKGVCYIYQYA